MSSAAKQLDFYESMYHFKKMFPKFDSDVIETVLRSNNGAVDKTIDALLQMSIEDDLTTTTATGDLTNQLTNTNFTSSVHSMDSYGDLPPSYTEFMSSIMVNGETSSTNAISASFSNNSNVSTTTKTINGSSNDWDSIRKKKSGSEKFAAVSLVSQIETPEEFFSSILISNNSKEITNQEKRCDLKLKMNSILVGELPKDFLRIKLTSEQMRKVKSTIKKAKRNEINAILSNVHI